MKKPPVADKLGGWRAQRLRAPPVGVYCLQGNGSSGYTSRINEDSCTVRGFPSGRSATSSCTCLLGRFSPLDHGACAPRRLLILPFRAYVNRRDLRLRVRREVVEHQDGRRPRVVHQKPLGSRVVLLVLWVPALDTTPSENDTTFFEYLPIF